MQGIEKDHQIDKPSLGLTDMLPHRQPSSGDRKPFTREINSVGPFKSIQLNDKVDVLRTPEAAPQGMACVLQVRSIGNHTAKLSRRPSVVAASSWSFQPGDVPTAWIMDAPLSSTSSRLGRKADGVLSPLSPVDQHWRDLAGAHTRTPEYFAFAYPSLNGITLYDQRSLPNEVACFAAFGGFVFFDADKVPLGAIAIKEASSAVKEGLGISPPGTLRLRGPFSPLEDDMKALCRDSGASVTIPSLVERGVGMFCWRGPDQASGRHAAFVYLYPNAPNFDCFFRVIEEDLNISQRTSTSSEIEAAYLASQLSIGQLSIGLSRMDTGSEEAFSVAGGTPRREASGSTAGSALSDGDFEEESNSRTGTEHAQLLRASQPAITCNQVQSACNQVLRASQPASSPMKASIELPSLGVSREEESSLGAEAAAATAMPLDASLVESPRVSGSPCDDVTIGTVAAASATSGTAAAVTSASPSASLSYEGLLQRYGVSSPSVRTPAGAREPANGGSKSAGSAPAPPPWTSDFADMLVDKLGKQREGRELEVLPFREPPFHHRARAAPLLVTPTSKQRHTNALPQRGLSPLLNLSPAQASVATTLGIVHAESADISSEAGQRNRPPWPSRPVYAPLARSTRAPAPHAARPSLRRGAVARPAHAHLAQPPWPLSPLS